MKKYIILFIVSVGLKLQSQTLNSIPVAATNPPDFSGLSYNQACEAVNEEERKNVSPEYISNLTRQIRCGNLSNGSKSAAIYLLGQFRPADTNSIELLIECVDFQSTNMQPLLGPIRWGKFPAVDALIKIGKPVINPILDDLPSENSKLRRSLLCEVLKEILRNYPR